ncbi:MAG: Ureidoglycolate hydrolase, partial [Leptolyngbyaceae cyanobacterium CAN_BIN12]|nr:Ureidoglycolate hydrolase [Leptolyngbyaceae cyanobacterium CAN_BIN12]
METYLLLKLRPHLITLESFQPFGQVIFACPDDQPYGDRDALLQLQNGTPRFHIMQRHNRGLKFNHITRHQRCTQCLGALEG